MAPVAVVEVLEAAAVPGAAADIRQQHDVAALTKYWTMRLIGVHELAGRAAVDPEDAGEALAGLARARTVEVGADLLAVEARIGDLLGRDQPLGDAAAEHRAGQRPTLARRRRRRPRRRWAGGGAEQVAEPPAVRRPVRRLADAHLRRDQHDRLVAGAGRVRRVDDSEVERAVVVLDVGDRPAVRRPGGVALVGLGGRDLARLAVAVHGGGPDVEPARPIRPEQEPAPVRRDQRIAERAAVVVVEEVPVLEHDPRLRAVAVHQDDLVVGPGLVEADVEDPAVRGELGVDLVAGVAR